METASIEEKGAIFFPILINFTLLFDLLWKKRVIPHILLLIFKCIKRILVSLPVFIANLLTLVCISAGIHFAQKKRKLNLFKTLVHRALMICSESKLDGEIDIITETLCNNGFPEAIVRSVIGDKLLTFIRQKSRRPRDALCISDYPGWVRLVINLPIRFLDVYGGVTLLLTSHVYCFAIWS